MSYGKRLAKKNNAIVESKIDAYFFKYFASDNSDNKEKWRKDFLVISGVESMKYHIIHRKKSQL